MKSNSGVTVASLTVYIIAMVIVIGIIASITSFFYTNVNNLDDISKNAAEFNKFNMYFIEDVKKTGNSVMLISSDKTSITFSSGNTYTFQDKSIYMNNIRICENIKNLKFELSNINQKDVVSVLVVVGDNFEYTTTKQYVLAR
jgi:hypothetical protein